MTFKIRVLLCTIILLAGAIQSQTQNAPRSEVAGIPVNYDEAKVGSYTLPDGTVVGYALTPGYETYQGLGWYGVIVQRRQT